MNTEAKRFVAVVGAYLLGAWLTVAYTQHNRIQCLSGVSDIVEQYRKCGLGDETFFGPLAWPIYWFMRSAKMLGGAT